MKYDPLTERRELIAEYKAALLPALRFRAKIAGYALAVHGSEARDLDIVAAPWRDGAADAEYLIDKLAAVVEAVTGFHDVGGPEEKPCGRLAWSIHLTPSRGNGPYLDVSVMPSSAEDKNGKNPADRPGAEAGAATADHP